MINEYCLSCIFSFSVHLFNLFTLRERLILLNKVLFTALSNIF